jgi:hypothetical protein
MSDWIAKLGSRMRGLPRKKPPRGKGGSAPAPVDPKPRPTLLTGGAEAPLDEA